MSRVPYILAATLLLAVIAAGLRGRVREEALLVRVYRVADGTVPELAPPPAEEVAGRDAPSPPTHPVTLLTAPPRVHWQVVSPAPRARLRTLAEHHEPPKPQPSWLLPAPVLATQDEPPQGAAPRGVLAPPVELNEPRPISQAETSPAPARLHRPRQATTPQPTRGDVVVAAGGGLEFTLPADWRAYEHCDEFSVALLLLPAGVAPETPFHDGMLLRYRCDPHQGADPLQQLRRELPATLTRRAPEATLLSMSEPMLIGPWQALNAVYQAPADAAVPMTYGALMLVRTAWGVVEIQVEAPHHVYRQRQATHQSILDSLQLEAPRPPQNEAGDEIVAAQEILGSWKSRRGKFRLHGDGRVEILLDAEAPTPLSPEARTRGEAQSLAVRGRFVADDDLLRVTWKDSTRSNYRWDLRDGMLLLTDHEGRINRLVRIFE